MTYRKSLLSSCRVELWSSRACEYGTKGCVVEHVDLDSSPFEEPSYESVEDGGRYSRLLRWIDRKVMGDGD